MTASTRALLTTDRRLQQRRAEPRGAAVAGRRYTERRASGRYHWFLNAAFDRITTDQAVERITQRPAFAPFAFVTTPNVDHLVRLAETPGMASLYAQAWLTVCDSRVLELLARFGGETVAVTPGSDLTETLLCDHIDPDEPVTVIGGTADVIDAVRSRYGLTQLHWFDAPMGLRTDAAARAACAEFVARHPARFVFICVGSPQQEMVAEDILDRGDCTGIGLCVGASFDFLAGKAKRAPRWMQRARLEWLHRLASEPRRLWKRYLIEGPKIVRIWLAWRAWKRRIAALEARLASVSFRHT